MSEKFLLRWNDFQYNAARIFDSLRVNQDLFDVTLVGEDLKQVSAHRLVLSSCSPFFRNIFKQSSHPNTLLFLDNVSYYDLHHVLDYIYKGELQIHQEDLKRFLVIAQKFKLDGLERVEVEEERSFNSFNSTEPAGMEPFDSFNSTEPADIKPPVHDFYIDTEGIPVTALDSTRQEDLIETNKESVLNLNRHLVPEDLKNLIISQNPERSIKFLQSQRLNTQMVVDDFILKKKKGPYVSGDHRVINWKCVKDSCHYNVVTWEGEIQEWLSILLNH